MANPITESTLESAALCRLGSLGYKAIAGDIPAPGEPLAERASFSDVILTRRLHDALARLNPHLPAATRCCQSC